jgi:predicted RNase H-like nuclease (RuvC/YqgF family)
MSPKFLMRSLTLLLAALSLFSIRLVTQDAPSVAEAARRARQQKQDAAKPAHVIDNDVIPSSPAASAPAASPAAPASDSSSAAPANASDASADNKSEGDNADADQKKEEIESLKRQIAEKKEKVDLQQREIALAQDSFYTNPDHERDIAGKQKLTTMQNDLTQSQSELADLQAKLAKLGPAPETKTPEAPKP